MSQRRVAGSGCLVIKNDGLGDLVLTSGILAGLARHVDGPLDLVTCEDHREIAERIPGIRRVLGVSRHGLRYRGLPRRLGWFWPVVGAEDRPVLETLAATEYDTALVLRRFIRQSTFVLMSAARARHRYRAWQLPTNLSRRQAEKLSHGWRSWQGPAEVLSELSYCRDFIAQALGVELEVSPRLELDDLGDVGGERDPRALGLSIGGASTNWPTASWLALAERLAGAGWTLHLFGGPDAQGLAGALAERVPACRSHVGRLGYLDSVPLLRSLTALIGNDTGFTHFATLLVPRVLVVLGGGTFGRFFPWPDGTLPAGHRQVVVFRGLDCYDCDWQCKFPRRHCLDRLEAEGVLAAFEHLLGTAEAPRAINLGDPSLAYSLAWRRGPWPGGRQRFDALPFRVGGGQP